MNILVNIDENLDAEDLIESIYESTQMSVYIREIVQKYFKPRFDTNSNSYFQSEEFALRIMNARQRAIQSFSLYENRDKDHWRLHFNHILSLEFDEDFCDFHHKWLTDYHDISSDPDLNALVKVIQSILERKGYDYETIMLVDDLKVNALINMAEEMDESKVYQAISKNLTLEMVHIPHFEHHIEVIESTVLQFSGDVLSPVTVQPNYNFARLLKLANISSAEYKEYVQDFFDLDLDEFNENWLNFRSLKKGREKSLLHIGELMSIIEYTPTDSTALFACNASVLEMLKVHPDETMIISGGFIGLYDFKNETGVLRGIDPSRSYVILADTGALLPSRYCSKNKDLYNPISVNMKIPGRFMETIIRQINGISKKGLKF